MTKVALTGATGFVGSVVLAKLLETNHSPLAINRRKSESGSIVNEIVVDAINSKTDWKSALEDIDVVIHCAARAHVMNDESEDPLAVFREVNTFGTLNLAKCAARDGVKRFIFVSSIKVNGESTQIKVPFKPDDSFIPTDPYGLSKYEAEIGLREIAKTTGMEVVIIRPPLVYGPGVKANFASMMKWVKKGIPLPLASIRSNKRSLVSVDNLVDLIITCIDHPQAGNQTFLVSDDHDVSTADLLREMARANNQPSRLIPFPVGLMQLAANLVGKGAVTERLFGSLQVDIEHTKKVLNWSPPVSFSEGIRRCFNK